MKNIYDVLRQKDAELQQLQRDVEVLRIAARLLAEDGDADAADGRSSISTAVAESRSRSVTPPATPAFP
jgi:hypothetical protein